MSCCNSSTQAFAWVGAILVNIGFIALISWGAVTLWPLGFVLSAFYTCFLFFLAVWLEKRGDDYTLSLGAEDQESEGVLENEPESQQQQAPEPQNTTATGSNDINKIPVLISLLYGLAVLSLGVTGFFLPVNLVPQCKYEYPDYPQPDWVWTTNITLLPSGIRSWASHDSTGEDETTTFGYVSSTGVTLFQGANFSQPDVPLCLFSTSSHPSGPPVQHKEFHYPHVFEQVTENAVCFQTMIPHQKRSDYETIVCSDGLLFRPMIEPKEAHLSKNYISSVTSWQGTLWFKVQTSDRVPQNNRKSASGIILFSLSPESMEATLHSDRVKNDNNRTSCNKSEHMRTAAAVALFSSAVPMTAISIALWTKKQIPSMGVTTYVGFTTIYFAIQTMITADYYEEDPIVDWRWWLAVSGFIWLLVSTHLLLTPRMAKAYEPLRWGFIVTSIAYLLGLALVVMYNSEGNDGTDTLWRWLMLNLFGICPVIFFGLATKTVFLTLLGAIGLLMDAARVAAFVGDHVKGQGAIPLVFLVFAMSGILVGALGVQLRTYQGEVHARAKHRVQVINEWIETWYTENNHTQDETLDTEALLTSPGADE